MTDARCKTPNDFPSKRRNARFRIGLLFPFCFSPRLSLLVFISLSLSLSASAEGHVDYLEQVKPILRERCFACHGALKQEAGLRLDTAALALKGGESGAAIMPGDASASLLFERVTATGQDERMPQEGEPLTDVQVALIRDWISQGSIAPADEQPEADPTKHWAFQPISRPDVPQTGEGWVRNPIDAFVQQRHQQRGIKPQPEAPRIVLLRRLYLDLIGIPPTLEEIAACEADSSPHWYEQTAKRLLDDPRHGERWARHWMDIWRYSDWWGLGDQLRNSQKHIWHWRDWIVESLNDDMPYDEMVRLMLAADELHPNDLNKLRATGYLARNFNLFNRPQWMEETVEHVSKGLLGLTMNCARCHDHKFDPLEQTDYYRMRAFFEPYHVRMDIVPGEADLSQDGIPRIYDGLLEEPTYLYVRGDERSPDKSKVITPELPAIFASDELKIEPIALPVEAWQPERRPWVLDAYISAAHKRVTAAESELKMAQEKVFAAIEGEAKARKEADVAKQAAVEIAEGIPIVADSFETLDATRWKLFGGEWIHEPGRLQQKKDGPAWSALRLTTQLPEDFDATLRFTTLDGSMWRSVGFAFDVDQADPSQGSTNAADRAQLVYVSAVANGSGIHAAYQQSGQWIYPDGPAIRRLPIELNHEYALRLQVRGALINASLDGTPLIAWESPLPRRDGALQVITFDALAVIHEVSVKTLDPAIVLRRPDASPENPLLTLEMAQTAVKEAQAEQSIAEAALSVAQAELESVERRAEAQRVEWNPTDQTVQAKTNAAVRAERLVTVAKSRNSVAVAEQALQHVTTDKKEAAEKSLKEAREALDNALKATEAEVAPADQYTKFKGAQWTPTRFLNSGNDDPEVKIPPQSSGRRTALANWVTNRNNPLAARVAINHIWTRHMGQPIVPTMFDFGRKGTPPTHPELLDWLASELIDSGWSMKHVHSLILNSAAYRMSSSMAEGDHGAEQDPENKLLWRRVPIRMESQLVRDSLLALAGTLDPTRGGPPVPSNQQETSHRRSLYFYHSNNERNLFLMTFDEALVKDCYRREQSIVPQQALALLNSQLAHDAAEKIAQRLFLNQPDDATFVRDAFRFVTGINPNQDEIAASAAAMDAWRNLPGGNDQSARTNLAWTLINHNDFVTLR